VALHQHAAMLGLAAASLDFLVGGGGLLTAGKERVDVSGFSLGAHVAPIWISAMIPARVVQFGHHECSCSRGSSCRGSCQFRHSRRCSTDTPVTGRAIKASA